MNHHEFTIPNQSALSILFHSLVGGLEHEFYFPFHKKGMSSETHWRTPWFFKMGTLHHQAVPNELPSGNLTIFNIAIENDHRNSGFSHEKWVDLSIAMLVYRTMNPPLSNFSFPAQRLRMLWSAGMARLLELLWAAWCCAPAVPVVTACPSSRDVLPIRKYQGVSSICELYKVRNPRNPNLARRSWRFIIRFTTFTWWMQTNRYK